MLVSRGILARECFQFVASEKGIIPLIAIPYSLGRSAPVDPRLVVFDFGVLEAGDTHSTLQSPYPPLFLSVGTFLPTPPNSR